MNLQQNFTPLAFELAVASPAAAAGEAAWQLRNENSLRIGLTYLELVITAATASQVELVRALTNGTATTSTAGLSVGLVAGGVDLARVDTAWAVQPTYDATPLYTRAGFLPATAGSRLIWTWPEDNPYIVPIVGSVVLRNTGGGAMSAGFVSARWLVGIPS